MSEDEEDLVQRLGITAKSLKVRFFRTTNGFSVKLTVLCRKNIARCICLQLVKQINLFPRR